MYNLRLCVIGPQETIHTKDWAVLIPAITQGIIELRSLLQHLTEPGTAS